MSQKDADVVEIDGFEISASSKAPKKAKGVKELRTLGYEDSVCSACGVTYEAFKKTYGGIEVKASWGRHTALCGREDRSWSREKNPVNKKRPCDSLECPSCGKLKSAFVPSESDGRSFNQVWGGHVFHCRRPAQPVSPTAAMDALSAVVQTEKSKGQKRQLPDFLESKRSHQNKKRQRVRMTAEQKNQQRMRKKHMVDFHREEKKDKEKEKEIEVEILPVEDIDPMDTHELPEDPPVDSPPRSPHPASGIVPLLSDLAKITIRCSLKLSIQTLKENEKLMRARLVEEEVKLVSSRERLKKNDDFIDEMKERKKMLEAEILDCEKENAKGGLVISHNEKALETLKARVQDLVNRAEECEHTLVDLKL